MTVIDRVYREATLPESAEGYVRRVISLGWEDRVQAHGRRRSDDGLEFGTSLPRGTVLRSGDCFVLDEPRAVVMVVERAEPVFLIEPPTPQHWGLYAYHIGNRHQPLMVTPQGILCPDVPGVEQLLRQHHIPHVRATLPFTPASAVVGHQH